ncbi:hypothetical protein BSKO_08843 [Bryopsis sp. KO-2023]|nr:hypothetical protein BSKO_08843 [Bryopsis sp. KO-2023]
MSAATGGGRLKFLSLHGFRTSGRILQQQLEVSNLARDLGDLVEFRCIDAPSEASAPPSRNVRETFEGPYYEWWNAVEDDDGDVFYEGWDKTLEYLEKYMGEEGPFDGLFGFSQGANLVTVLVGLQQNGLALKDVNPVDACVIVGGMGSRFKGHTEAFTEPIRARSLHLIGSRDPLGKYSDALLERFDKPTVVRHDRGHIVPPLTGDELATTRAFLSQIRSKH